MNEERDQARKTLAQRVREGRASRAVRTAKDKLPEAAETRRRKLAARGVAEGGKKAVD